MQDRIPKYAIAFHKTKIDFFERIQEDSWSLVERIETPSLQEEAIVEHFSDFAQEWLKISRDVICWFPRSLSKILRFDKEPVPETISERFYGKNAEDKRDFEDLEVLEKPAHETGKKEVFVVEKSDYQELVGFLNDRGFEVKAVSTAPRGEAPKSPPLFEIKSASQASKSAQKSDNAASSPPRWAQKLRLPPIVLPASLAVTALVLLGGLSFWILDEVVAHRVMQTPAESAAPAPATTEEVVKAETPEVQREIKIAPPKADPEFPAQPAAPRASGDGDGLFQSRPENHGEHFANLNGDTVPLPVARDEAKIEANFKRIAALEENNPLPPPSESAANATVASSQAIRSGGGSIASATSPGGIDLKDISLLGIYGPSGKPMAMIRTARGDVSSVKQGEIVDGWAVLAISRSEVIVKKGGAQKRLKVPN